MSDTLASLVVKIGADISGYTSGLKDATDQLTNLSGNIESLGEKLAELGMEFLAFEGLKELGTEAVEAAAGIEKTTIALTALTGSAEVAGETIERMEGLANSEALSFPELLAAAQHMTAVGMSLEQIQPALAAAGNASWALGTSVSDVSSRMEGMALSGMAGGRQLKALGLTAADLADALGVTEAQAAKTFKALDETDRLTALTIAMGKFGDVATQEAAGVSGSWQNLKTTWHSFMVSMGEDIEPVVGFLIRFGTTATNFLNDAFSNNKNIDALKILIDAAQSGQSYEASSANAHKADSGPMGVPADAETGYQGAAKAANDLANAVKAITDAQADSLTPFGKALENLAAVQQAYKYGYASADELKQAQNDVTKAFADANPTLQKWNTSVAAGKLFTEGLALNLAELARVNTANFDQFIASFQAGNLEAPALVEHVQKLTEGTTALNAMVAMGTKDMDYLNEAYKALGLTMDSVSGAVSSRVIAAFDKIAADNTTTVDGIEQAWAKASGSIDKLAKTDLPAAIAQYDAYIATLQKLGAPLADIYAAQEKELQLEINLAAQRGTSATAQIVQLTNIQERTRNLSDATSGLGNIYAGLVSTYDKSFAALGKGIADNIVDLKSWGDVFKGVLQNIEKEILENLIGGALKELAASLNGITGTGGLLGSIGKMLGGSSGGAANAATVAAQNLNTAALHTLSTVLATHGGILGVNTGATAADTAATSTGTGATVAHTGVLGAHMGVLGAHLGVLTAHLTTMIANTVGVLANTIATIANSVWLAIKSALSFFGFAGGGVPPVGVPSIVGENGPEFFIPNTKGTILPAGLTALLRSNSNGYVPPDMMGANAPQINSPDQTVYSSANTQNKSAAVVNLNFPNVKTTRQAAGELARWCKSQSASFSPASS